MNEVEKVLEIFNKGYNKQVVLYGPPGTSKTYSATLIAGRFLNGGEEVLDIEAAKKVLKDNPHYKLVQFHPSYNYEDFVRGIKIEIRDVKNQLGEVVNSIPDYKVVNKVFADIAADAQSAWEVNTSDPAKFVLVIDEINRAPVASVLGELIYGLEYRGEAISTPYAISDKNDSLIIPPNLYIIGTMNTADRSIGSIDYAVRRRFAFVELPSSKDAVVESWKEAGLGKYDQTSQCFEKGSAASKVIKVFEEMEQLFSKTNLVDPSIQVSDIKIGHTYFLYDKEKCGNDEEQAKAYMRYRIEYQIVPVIEEYVKDGILNSTENKKEEWIQLFS